MRVFIKTYGCRLNQAETARLAAGFRAADCQVVGTPHTADVVVVHGCAVTRAAEQEGLHFARGLKRAARQAGNPEPVVVLSGCVAGLVAGRPVAGVDLLVPHARDDERVSRVLAHLGLNAAPAAARPARPPGRKRGLLKVQDGCDFFCSYCIVPHLRGAPVSRPWRVVLDEARALAEAGAAELVVTGCNLACYRDNGRGLPELVAALAALDGLGRVRVGSVEPGTIELELAEVMAATPKVCRQLHLPLQSGDAGILAAMGRRYTPEAYAATAREIARRLPDLGLGTDVIAGFPGESESAFANTRRLVEELPFGNLHVFPYSERPGTPAAVLGGRVPPAVRKERARALIALGAEKRRQAAEQAIGRPAGVLIEKVDERGIGWGWTGSHLGCRIAGLDQSVCGRIVTCRVERVEGGELVASVCPEAPAARSPRNGPFPPPHFPCAPPGDRRQFSAVCAASVFFKQQPRPSGV